MARKLPALQRIVGPEAIYAIVYGEISSSLYFALGVVALWALGMTPFVLLGAGVLFAMAVGAYAEGALAVDQVGGSSAITRRAFGDLAGFVVGWAVLLDFIVIIALSLLFVPHYALAAFDSLNRLEHPDDEIIAACLAVVIGAIRMVRRPQLYAGSVVVAILDILVQGLLAVLGLALVFDLDKLTGPLNVGTAPTWDALAYSIPLAMVAFAGLEIVANLLRETKKPGMALTRGMGGAVAATVVVYAVIAASALSAFPVHRVPGTPSGWASDISTVWVNAPLAGVADEIGKQLGDGFASILRGLVGLSAVLILLLNATGAFSGATRLIRSLGEAGALPQVFARTSRRSNASPAAIVLMVAGVALIFPVAAVFDQEVTGLVSIYSFGILLAFMAIFLSIVFLRVTEPGLERPFRMRANLTFGRTEVPFFALVGFALSWLSWLLVLGTHRAARIVPPLWLVAGLVIFVVMRRTHQLPILSGRYRTPAVPPPEITEVPYGVIVVPMKQAGPIEEEMLAIACKLAQSDGARVLALKAIEVPLSSPLDVDLPEEADRADKAMAMARSFGPDYNVEIETRVERGRAISTTVARVAREAGAGLILLGAVPRSGSTAGQARVFSETVENLLRRADCRVIVTAFPPGTASLPEPDVSAVATTH